MNYESAIIKYVVYMIVYFLLRSIVDKQNRSLKKMVFFSYGLFLAIVFLSGLAYIDEPNKNVIEDVVSLGMFFLTLNILLSYYNKYNKDDLNKNIIKSTYTNGRKLIYILSSFLSLLILILLLINTSFKTISFSIVLLTIIFILSIVWNIIYIKDFKKKNITKEIVMVYNNHSYIQYDVSNKLLINLKKLLKLNSNIAIEKSFMIFLKENSGNKLIWTFYTYDIDIERDENFDKDFFNKFYNIDGRYVEMNLETNEINILL